MIGRQLLCPELNEVIIKKELSHSARNSMKWLFLSPRATSFNLCGGWRWGKHGGGRGGVKVRSISRERKQEPEREDMKESEGRKIGR